MIIREYVIKDKPFITSTWFQSYYPKSNLSFDDYKHFQNKIIESNIIEGLSLIACDDSDENQIFGWINYRMYNNEPVVNYLYIKSIYRRFGIAKKLMKQVLEDCEYYYYTHAPEDKKILESLTFASGEFCEHLRYKEFYEVE